MEAQPKPLHVVIVRRLHTKMAQFQGSVFRFPTLVPVDGQLIQNTGQASLSMALDHKECPVCLSYNAIRPVKVASIRSDTMVVVDM